MPGMGELIIILLIVLLVFGAGKLPAIGDSLGRSIRNFKRASSGDDEIEVSKKKELGGKKAKELDDGDDDDVEDADVVASRRKAAKKEA
ncbi:MAG: twin-arginine translocase TatA/TatE family subunit [Kofleriaceae bacterium]|nr:twin-arginine translocase TatA/TatE family subunit [Kofleriaceae bacterium]MCB9571518.1 twin-arginine translocase TatA/TatE family subunit [Kofleriaceae bacterium]